MHHPIRLLFSSCVGRAEPICSLPYAVSGYFTRACQSPGEPNKCSDEVQLYIEAWDIITTWAVRSVHIGTQTAGLCITDHGPPSSSARSFRSIRPEFLMITAVLISVLHVMRLFFRNLFWRMYTVSTRTTVASLKFVVHCPVTVSSHSTLISTADIASSDNPGFNNRIILLSCIV